VENFKNEWDEENVEVRQKEEDIEREGERYRARECVRKG
jgi:hypothetical protein